MKSVQHHYLINKFGQLIDAPFRPFFSTFNMDRRTDQQAHFPIEMQFYISAMFVGFPDEIHEEKPSFLDFENNWLRMDGRTDGRTDPLIEMRGRI